MRIVSSFFPTALRATIATAVIGLAVFTATTAKAEPDVDGFVIVTTTLPPPTTTLPPTTTTTLPITGACCAGDGCYVLSQVLCELKISGTYAGDGTTCEDPGVCTTCGDGFHEPGEECDDGNTDTGDGCDGACVVEPCWACVDVEGYTSTTLGVTGFKIPISDCDPDDNLACDDGDLCTVGDSCSGGTCAGEDVLIPAACKWAMVGGDPAKTVRARTRGQTQVIGRVCGEDVFIGEESQTKEVAGMAASGDALRIARQAVIVGDVATGGGAVRGKPAGTLLPGLATDTVPGATVVAKDMTSNYDTTGNHALIDECNDAQADIDVAVPLLDALPSTANLGNVQIGGNGSLTIAPGSPAGVTAGGINVIDMNKFLTGNNATLTLDGGGNAATVYILRIDKKFDLHFRSDVLLTNGQSAANVIIYGRNKCKIGEETTGGGTVICPEGKLLMEERVTWGGSLLGGKQIVQVRDSTVLTHVPLQIGN